MAAKTTAIRCIIDEIVRVNRHIATFWSSAHGWAPKGSADLLSKSRLDRQISLSACLRLWLRQPAKEQDDGRLILAWANLGTLIEGSMKFFLCVFDHDYANSPVIDRKNNALEQDGLTLEVLRQFFMKHVWTDVERKHWGPFVELVQQRRNGIHAYKQRDIGDRKEFTAAIRKYLEFVSDMDSIAPYPDCTEEER